MSLLERLTTSNGHEEETFLRRAFEMRGRPIQKTEIPAAAAVDPAAAVRSLVRELETVDRQGIETPSHIFSLLYRHLQVQKGAILVPEAGSDVLVPLAASGIDITSRRKLRVQRSEIAPFLESDVSFITGDERHFLKNHLSSREYREALRIAVFPFEMNTQLLALLLIFDSPFLDLDEDVLRVLLSALNDAASRILFQGREKTMRKAAPVVLYPHAQLEQAISVVADRARNRATIPTAIVLSLGGLESGIIAHHPHLDPFRLRQDIDRTIAALMADQAQAIPLESDKLALLLSDDKGLDIELMVHQLQVTVGSLFGIRGTTLGFEQVDPDTLRSEPSD